MTARYFDSGSAEDSVRLLGNSINGEDSVRLLSNPLNNDHLPTDDCDHMDDVKTNNVSVNYCLTCHSASSNEVSNLSVFVDNDYPLSTGSNRDCHHCHQFIPKKSNNHPRSKLIFAMCLCLVFMTTEIIGGYFAGSLAVISDGAHLLTDLVGFLISLIAISSSKKKCSKKFNFGFYRIEVLATLSSILLIWIMTAIILYLAVLRLLNNDYGIKVDVMILVSALGVITNIVMFLVLHGGCQSDHRHSHHSHSLAEPTSQNINVRAALIHVIGDLVQSIGVFISSFIIKFNPNAKIMDPICTFIFSVLVICSTLKLSKDAISILMESFPSSIDYNALLMSLQGLNGVRHVHSLSVWALTLDVNVLAVHLAVDDTADRDAILLQAQILITRKFNITYHTIQIEKYQPKCIHACQHCRPLWK